MPDEKKLDDIEVQEDEDLYMIWCPSCDKILTNEYKRCPKCGEVLDKKWQVEFNVIGKLEADQDISMKQGDYDKVIDIAETIISIGKKIKDKSAVDKQEDIIIAVKQKTKDDGLFAEIEENCRKVKIIFDKLVSLNRIMEAHDTIEEFEAIYGMKESIFKDIPLVKELLSKHDNIWDEFITKQADAFGRLESLEDKIITDVSAKDFTAADKKWEEVRTLLRVVIDDDLIEYWNGLEAEYQKEKIGKPDQLKELKEKIDVLRKESKQDLHKGKLLASYNGFKQIMDMLEEFVN